ncbi:hypothetical protein [Actinokineospora sp. NBRC 105648]|uniref:hypothetical protein n=1 Tax=Actinokineospora sp. NBRC 105648 TaxID=3032206 RepID=UPI0024A521F2|nr:hypothetical protein [Actinokineospora sp. NBRC 105648]GLZ42994.1 hypothetical protein Acsp05_66180 [Actinokineospora sp. NBRC 105648]
MASFDANRVTPIEWAGIGAGVLAFISSFFPWYSLSFSGSSLAFAGISTSLTAWGVGLLGWLPVLLLVAAAVLILLPHFGNAVKNQPLIWLILAAVSVVFIIIRWLTLSSSSGIGALGADSGISDGAGFGLYLGLLAAVVSTVAAFLTFRAAPRAAPGHPGQPNPGYPAA